MRLRLLSFMVFILSAGLAMGAEPENRLRLPVGKPKNAVFIDFTQYLYSIIESEQPLVGVHYERSLGSAGVSLIGAFLAGFSESDDDTHSALALGIGLRQYLLSPFAGNFLQFQTLGGFGYHRYRSGSSPSTEEQRYTFTSLEYGYKWQSKAFLFALHAGPCLRTSRSNIATSFTLGVDVGFPFSAGSFLIP